MPQDLIKSFVLQRTYIRIKQLNSNLIATQKRPYSNTDRKLKKKLKKLLLR